MFTCSEVVNHSSTPTNSFAYSRFELMEIRVCVTWRLPASVRRKLDRLAFPAPLWRPRARGCRAGQRLHRPIPVRWNMDRPRGSHQDTHRAESQHRPTLMLVYPVVERCSRPPARKLGLGLLNICSLINKTENILELFADYKLDMLILTETWHENSDAVAVKRLRGHGLNVVEAARTIPREANLDNIYYTNHGGIAFVSRPGVTVAKLDTKLNPRSFELLCCRISVGHKSIILAAIYRPGSRAITDHFFTEFAVLLESLSTFKSPIWIAGDMNLHLERPTDKNTMKLIQLLDTFNLRQLVREPTHDRGGLLDVVISPADEDTHDVLVADTGLSDHRLVRWTLPVARPQPEFMTIRRRRWALLDRGRFIDRLKESSLCSPQDLIEPATATDLADRYHTVITGILDDLAPFVESTVPIRPHLPYYDQDCRKARQKARRLERAFQKRKKRGFVRDDAAYNAWREALKDSRRLVRAKGRQFWKSSLESAASDSGQTWKHLDRLLGNHDHRGRVTTSFSADDFHQHLEDKITAIRRRTSDAEPVGYTEITGSSLTELSAPTREDVIAIVRASPNKQCDLDPLPVWLLKEVIDTLAPFLVTLMTTSLRTGEFPSCWKHAIVRPRLKRVGANTTDTDNYRPVSNLTFLSKVLERFVNTQMVGYLAANGLMPKKQSAYRRGHSTESAILRIFNDIVDAISNDRVALLCLLDLSAAFDTVDHEIMVRRLELTYGIKGDTLKWLQDYLTDRTQSVWWNGVMSSPRPVLSGVPQGSVLGPLLFILYVADIGRIVEECGLAPHAYADDVQILASCPARDMEQLRDRVTACIAKIKLWTEANRLALNPAKTEVLWITTPRKTHLISHAPLVIDQIPIVPSTEVRLLGVLLDESLSLRNHIGIVARNSFYQLRRIRAIRRHIPASVATQLVRALVLTRIDYCNSILLGTPDYQLNRLQMVLNASTRVIFQTRWCEHVTPQLRDRLHWLRIPERVIYKRCWFTFRALYDPFCPDYLSVLLRKPPSTEGRLRLRSSSRVRLMVPPPSKTAKLGERSVTRGNPALWNALPDSVTNATNLETFAKKLKTHLFGHSFNSIRS